VGRRNGAAGYANGGWSVSLSGGYTEGIRSFAMGNAISTGNSSVAFSSGYASGDESFAMGSGSTASQGGMRASSSPRT